MLCFLAGVWYNRVHVSVSFIITWITAKHHVISPSLEAVDIWYIDEKEYQNFPEDYYQFWRCHTCETPIIIYIVEKMAREIL